MKSINRFKILGIVAVSVLAIVTATFSLNACSKEVAPPKSFAFDSWDTIAKVAEGGLDNLISTYKPIGNTFIIQDFDDENETLAKTRRIYLEGQGNFKVRVIGENHDTCENGKSATLTFEFTKIISDVPFSPPDKISNNWENSELRKYLNDKLYQSFPQDLKSSIKAVKKDTCKGNSSSDVQTTVDKVFPLSVSEINAMGKTNLKEGEAYKIYKDHPYTPGSDDDPRVKDDKSYWLRSPMPQNSINAYVIRVGKDEGFFSQVCFDDCTEGIGVIPCFCI